MSSLSSKDRVSLCSFTFSDGRRCRTPRNGNHPHFCFYHAQKEARAHAAESLSKDLAYFFSGDYLSACDLSTALGRLIPAVLRGDVKPRAARTVAYMAQTLLQAIHVSQREYSYAFGDDGWRKSIRNSVNGNHDYLFPPAPKPAPRSDQAPHVVAGLQTGGGQAAQPVSSPPSNARQPAAQPSTPTPQSEIPPAPAMSWTLSGQAPAQARSPIPTQATPTPTPTAAPAPSPTPSHAPHPIPATQTSPAATPAPQPVNPSPTALPAPPTGPNRDAPWLHFDDTRRIPPDSHLL